MYPYRIFTLALANIAVLEVATLTRRAQRLIEEVRYEYRSDEPGATESLQD